MSSFLSEYLPIFIFICIGFALAVGMTAVSFIIGDTNPDKEKYFFYTLKDGKDIITSIKVINLKKSNHYTDIHINNIILDSGIKDNMFRENRLKRRPK